MTAFQGVVLAMIWIAFPNVVQLQWTNPSDSDLYEMRFTAYRTGASDTLAMPVYRGRQDETVEPPHLLPGRIDSLWVAVPCESVAHWQFWCYAVDTAGNVSAKSNIAYVTVHRP